MSLPRPPISHSTAIPNQPFSTEEVYYLEGNQGHLPLGSGLYIDPVTGEFTNIEPSPYIYCTPQYSNLPVTYPPYGCETEVNTTGVTDFTDAWKNCNEITEFPCVDSSEVTDFTESWKYCRYMNSFPNLNTGSGTVFYETWAGCYGLTSFPKLDLSSGVDFTAAWYYCDGLEEFPPLDFSNGEVFSFTWSGLYSVTSFPVVDTSKGVDFSGAWYDNPSFTSFPELNTGSGENFRDTWLDCDSLEDFPLLNFSNGTSFERTWGFCYSLTSFPLVYTGKGVDFSSAWCYCGGLTSFPEIDVSQGENFGSSPSGGGGTWNYCSGLTSFPALDFSSGNNFEGTWANCTNLASFPAGLFNNCTATQFSYAWYNCALSQQSVDNILISLDTAGQSNGVVNIDGGTSAAPSLAGWNAVASLEGKGWTVTVNGSSPFSTPTEKNKVEFPKDPKPFSEFTDPETREVYEWVRQRLRDGTFKADDPGTIEDEAWHWVRVK